jgi:hypothetical protein
MHVRNPGSWSSRSGRLAGRDAGDVFDQASKSSLSIDSSALQPLSPLQPQYELDSTVQYPTSLHHPGRHTQSSLYSISWESLLHFQGAVFNFSEKMHISYHIISYFLQLGRTRQAGVWVCHVMSGCIISPATSLVQCLEGCQIRQGMHSMRIDTSF